MTESYSYSSGKTSGVKYYKGEMVWVSGRDSLDLHKSGVQGCSGQTRDRHPRHLLWLCLSLPHITTALCLIPSSLSVWCPTLGTATEKGRACTPGHASMLEDSVGGTGGFSRHWVFRGEF
ncbi:hypothetical protein KIL84_018528 [Mauremys mutica]|uniref:Uncharacterized protein n=1 Tax=Mauremys mutica TaxID=74926 RepID=A0A9D3XS34_9SAUR|nr:hypothetical protein KIL84_018528 [Mauremys mutica]